MALTTVFLSFFVYFEQKQNIYRETFCRFNKLYDLCTNIMHERDTGEQPPASWRVFQLTRSKVKNHFV